MDKYYEAVRKEAGQETAVGMSCTNSSLAIRSCLYLARPAASRYFVGQRPII